MRQRGGALTELVILVPVLVMLIYGSMYLTELGVFKLKAQEIARYSAWSMAVRPLSDYDDFEHGELGDDSRDRSMNELERLYLDLDGGRDRFLPQVGKSGEYLGAIYSGSEIRMRPTQLLPGALNSEWASPLSALGLALNILGIGTGSGDLFSGPFNRIGMNGRGEAHGIAEVLLTPPHNAQDIQQAQALVQYEREMGFDLRRWNPLARPLRDVGADGQVRRIETVLVADPWRLEEGFSAHPERDTAYANAVDRVSKKAFDALPFGMFLNAECRLPNGITSVIPLAGCPEPKLFSRPYTQRRPTRPSHNATVRAGAGQVDIFEETHGRAQEGGAVQNFETLPLYYEPNGQNGYLKALNRRGANFMGCPEAQTRRCRF